ncbi:MAG: aldose 1-epimerase family protein [Actinobacteria bacterium]|nr:aldose 1-epimerase family protein [Actinomycetota bacterium]MCL6087074.1 aldose 1-epimerase family protein [Actinomycetota bacterium]
MEIFGKKYSRTDILKKVGDISQLGGVKQYEFSDGTAKNARAVDLKSPGGIEMTVILDRAMDISSLTYKNIPISWKSATKEASPIYYESKGVEWLRTFFGGLLTTCGLTYFGPPCTDQGEDLGLHGRISNLPASNVLADCRWENDNYVMWVQGRIREVRALYEKLELSRKITAFADRPVILIEDIVENIGFKSSPLMILYHMNLGFPLLDSATKLLLPKKTITTPRDETAKREIGNFNEFCEPVDNFSEQVFIHNIEPDRDGNGNVALINNEFNNGEGLGISIKFNKKNLPYLIQWKHAASGEYVCGLEPANSLLGGRNVEIENRNVRFINPGEKINFNIEINILSSKKEIENYIKNIQEN